MRIADTRIQNLEDCTGVHPHRQGLLKNDTLQGNDATVMQRRREHCTTGTHPSCHAHVRRAYATPRLDSGLNQTDPGNPLGIWGFFKNLIRGAGLHSVMNCGGLVPGLHWGQVLSNCHLNVTCSPNTNCPRTSQGRVLGCFTPQTLDPQSKAEMIWSFPKTGGPEYRPQYAMSLLWGPPDCRYL